MMIGCDIVEIERIKNAYTKLGDSFSDRVLSEREREIFIQKKRSMSFLSGRFAAKEAVSKSLKTGLGKLGLKNIEILAGEDGEPVVYLNGQKADMEVSISHSKNMAMAVAIENRGNK
ncbi:holo-ACP synthase [Flexistipes sp.]|uniref:holo-ACP synthase n=1 Tax=Flexistipes sp. TaxID=3088135 RepID=UPI002E20E52E|nr:holo-ACP synthase [Flexistipes sp.]